MNTHLHVVDVVIAFLVVLLVFGFGAAVWLALGQRIMPNPGVAQAVDAAPPVTVAEPIDLEHATYWRVPAAPAPVLHHRLGVVERAEMAILLLLSTLRVVSLTAPPRADFDGEVVEAEPGESTEDDVEPETVAPERPPDAPEVAHVPAPVAAALKLGPDWPAIPEVQRHEVPPQDAALFNDLITARAAESRVVELDIKGPAVPDWPTGSWAILNHTGSRA